ncbi:MAG: metallophosphoesterase family protein [Rhodovarius sp.]|nr:metallophosphoesterase family protein [Rhodovarius sp.]
MTDKQGGRTCRCGMLIALLADIHANLEALEACLADAAARGAERLVLLGDLVGYGADPLPVLARIRALAEAGAVVLLGNHDEAALKGAVGFNPVAAQAIRWTAAQLDASARAFLSGLPLTHREDGLLFVHADASDPAGWRYVRSLRDAAACLAGTDARFVFCGHTHLPLLACASGSGRLCAREPQPGAVIPLAPLRRAVAVIGAVGQPRDGNPAACYGLLDTLSLDCRWLRVPYDIAAAAAKIRAAGLPESLAARLFRGL